MEREEEGGRREEVPLSRNWLYFSILLGGSFGEDYGGDDTRGVVSPRHVDFYIATG